MAKKKRSFEPQSISEVLGELISQKNIKGGITKVRAEQAWGTTMGASVSQYTQEVSFRETTLFEPHFCSTQRRIVVWKG